MGIGKKAEARGLPGSISRPSVKQVPKGQSSPALGLVAWRMDVMSSLRSMVVFLVLSALALACSGIKVNSDYDPSADFTQLRTWGWLPHAGRSGDPRLDSTLLDSRIRAAVQSEFDAKGYTLATSGTPDFQVAYHVSIEGKLDVDTVYSGYSGGRYGGVGRYGGATQRPACASTTRGRCCSTSSSPGRVRCSGGAAVWRPCGKRAPQRSAPNASTRR